MTTRLIRAACCTIAAVLVACGGGADEGEGGAPGTAGAATVTDASSAAGGTLADGSAARPVSTATPTTLDPAETADTAPSGQVIAATTVAPTTSAPPTTSDPPVPVTDWLACAAAIPLPERIALVVWPAVYSVEWDAAVAMVDRYQVGGVILMRPDGWTATDVAPNLARLDAAARRGLVIATDEEGGAVQRLAILGELPSQQTVSELGDLDAATRLIADHAARVAAAGVDMVLGPVVDVVPPGGEVPLTRSRFFTGDPAAVTAFGRAYIAGWESSGLSTVIKHFPGHGPASADTHLGTGVTPPLADLERWDLLPFAALADTATAVMIGHLTVPDLTDGLPATQSPAAIRYLRERLGYADALVMTDALGMEAVGRAEDEAAVLALAAGIDVVIFTNTGATASVLDAIAGAIAGGTLSESRLTEAAGRVLRELGADRSGC